MLSHCIRDVYHLKRIHMILPDFSLGEKVRRKLLRLPLPVFNGSATLHSTEDSTERMKPNGITASGDLALLPVLSASPPPLPAEKPLNTQRLLQLLECLVYFKMGASEITWRAFYSAYTLLPSMTLPQLAAVLVAYPLLRGDTPPHLDTGAEKTEGSRSTLLESAGGGSLAHSSATTAQKETFALQLENELRQLFFVRLNESTAALLDDKSSHRSTHLTSPAHRTNRMGGSSPHSAETSLFGKDVEVVPLIGGELLAVVDSLLTHFFVNVSKELETAYWDALASHTILQLPTFDNDELVELIQRLAAESVAMPAQFFDALKDVITSRCALLPSPASSVIPFHDDQLRLVIIAYEQLGHPSEALQRLSRMFDGWAKPDATRGEQRQPSASIDSSHEGGKAAEAPTTGMAGITQEEMIRQVEVADSTTLLELTLQSMETDKGDPLPPIDPQLTLRTIQRMRALLGLPSAEDASSSPHSPPAKPNTTEVYVYMLIMKTLIESTRSAERFALPMSKKELSHLLDRLADVIFPIGTARAGITFSTQEKEIAAGLFIGKSLRECYANEPALLPHYFLSSLVLYVETHPMASRFVHRPVQQAELLTSALVSLESYGGKKALLTLLPVLSGVMVGADGSNRGDQIFFLSMISTLLYPAHHTHSLLPPREGTWEVSAEEKQKVRDSAAQVLNAVLRGGGSSQRWTKGAAASDALLLLRSMLRLGLSEDRAVIGVVQLMREEAYRFRSSQLIDLLLELARLGVRDLSLFTAVAGHVLDAKFSSGGGSALGLSSSSGRSKAVTMGRQQPATVHDLCMLLYSFTFVLKGMVKAVHGILARLKLSGVARGAGGNDISLLLYSLVKLQVTRHVEVSGAFCDQAAKLLHRERRRMESRSNELTASLADPQKLLITATELSSIWSSLRVLNYLHEPLLEATTAVLEAKLKDSVQHREALAWLHPSELRMTLAAMFLLCNGGGGEGGSPPAYASPSGRSTRSTSTAARTLSHAFGSIEGLKRFQMSPELCRAFKNLCFSNSLVHDGDKWDATDAVVLDGQQLFLVVTALGALVRQKCLSGICLQEYAMLAIQCERAATVLSTQHHFQNLPSAVEMLLGLQELRRSLAFDPLAQESVSDSFIRLLTTWRRSTHPASERDYKATLSQIVPSKSSPAREGGCAALTAPPPVRKDAPPLPLTLWKFVCNHWGKLEVGSPSAASNVRERLLRSGVLKEFSNDHRVVDPHEEEARKAVDSVVRPTMPPVEGEAESPSCASSPSASQRVKTNAKKRTTDATRPKKERSKSAPAAEKKKARKK